MNQIPNPGQQQGQHSVQSVPHHQQPIRFASGQYPQAQPHYGGGYGHQYQNMIYAPAPNNIGATLTLPQNSNIITSQTNGMTMVDIATPFVYDQSNMVQQVSMQPPYQYMHQYAPPQQQTYQQPPPKPIVVREKRILSIFDPNTNAEVALPKHEKKPDVSGASSPFEPAKQDTKPHTPVNELKEIAPETRDIDLSFNQAVADRNKPHTPVNEPKEAASEIEDIKSAFSLAVANRVVSAAEHSPTPEQVAPAIVLEEPQPETSGAEEERYEASDAIPPNLDRASLIHEYEKRMDELLNVPENAEDIINKVYSRKLVQILREIIKNFHTIPCPLPEQELKRIGIDRATMPQPANVSHKSNKYQGGHSNNFNPSWASNAQPVRPRYNPRGSKNNDGQNKSNKNQRAPITNRPSIQRKIISTLSKDPNAWKPDVMNAGNSVDPASVESRIAKVRKDVRGLLNKITPTTYADLSREMMNKSVWQDEDTLPTVVDLIFIKAVEEPTFVKLYSDLCHSLHKAEQNMEQKNFKRHFHSAIIRKCQSSFENTALSQYQETIDKLKQDLKEEEEKEDKNEKRIADLNDQLIDLNAKEKRRMLGTIKFISHLFRIGLLNYKIIENCIVILIRNAEQSGSELMTEFAVDLMKHVGPYIVTRNEDTTKLDGYVTYLDKFKGTVSNRVKFMIVDLMELRDKKWVKKGDGPKTKEEVKMDVLKEEEQNKRDRDVYEQSSADQNRKRSNVIDKKNYTGRPSVDKKDRVNAAVVASSTSVSSLKKDTSLLKYDQQPTRLGAQKKAWGTMNSNANTNASAGNKSVPKTIARQSADARHNNSNDSRKSTSQKENKPTVAPTSKVDSRSASATPPLADPSSSRSQNNTPTFTPEGQFDMSAFKSGFEERLRLHLEGTDIDEIAKSLIEFNNELNNPILFFEQMCAYSCEHLKKNQEKERHTVPKLVLKCFQNPVLKSAFAPAFKKYCKFLVENDIEGDVPHLKFTFPEFVARLMTDQNAVPYTEFVEGFKEFHEAENYMFARTLAEFGRILHNRKDDVSVNLGFLFEDFAKADSHYKSDDMQQILAKQPIDYDENHKNLKELIA